MAKVCQNHDMSDVGISPTLLSEFTEFYGLWVSLGSMRSEMRLGIISAGNVWVSLGLQGVKEVRRQRVGGEVLNSNWHV